MLRQARAEVMLHMAHSLFSTFNISFEILEKSKVIFNKLKFWWVSMISPTAGVACVGVQLSKTIHILIDSIKAEFIPLFFFISFIFSWGTWPRSQKKSMWKVRVQACRSSIAQPSFGSFGLCWVFRCFSIFLSDCWHNGNQLWPSLGMLRLTNI